MRRDELARRLFLRWVIATFAVALPFLMFSPQPAPADAPAPTVTMPPPGMLVAIVLVALAVFAAMAALFARAQWWALETVLPPAEKRAWIGNSVVGTLIGVIPIAFVGILAYRGLAIPDIAVGAAAVASGVVIAVFQWRVLRRHLVASPWWILAPLALAPVAVGANALLPLPTSAVFNAGAHALVTGAILVSLLPPTKTR